MNTSEQSIKKEVMSMDDYDSGSEDNCLNEELYLWDEEYGDNNVSLLKEVNELAYFKQTMEKLKNEIPQVYA